MNMKDSPIRVTAYCYMKPVLRDQLDEAAERLGLSRSDVMRFAIEHYLKTIDLEKSPWIN
jgi:predicted transcriptional regulator